MSKTFIDILEELQTTSGTNDKIALIASNSDDWELKAYLKLALDKGITFGVAQIPEYEIVDPRGCPFDSFQAMLDLLSKRITTGGAANDSIISCLAFCTPLQEKWYRKLIQKDLSCIGIGQRTFEKAYGESGFKFRLGLAEEIGELENAEDVPGWLDKKANGVRTVTVVDNAKLDMIYGGRDGLEAKNFYFAKEELELLVSKFGPKLQSCVFDGETHVNDNLSNTMTLYGFKSRPKEEFIGAKGKLKEKAYADYLEKEEEVLGYLKDAKFTIFDFMPLENWEKQDYHKPQDSRKEDLVKIQALIKELELTRIEVIESEWVKDKEAAVDAAQKWIARGFEGGIWKPGNGLYQWKRSRNWIKIKEVEDFEVRITGFEIQKPKYNSDGSKKPDMAGKVLCITKDGAELKIGTGKALSEKIREHMWNDPGNYIDKIGTCSAQKKSDKKGSTKYINPRLDILRLDRNSLED